MKAPLIRFFTSCALGALVSFGCADSSDPAVAGDPTVEDGAAATGDDSAADADTAADDTAAAPEQYEDGPAQDMPASFSAALTTSLIHEHFTYDQPLITNEYATYNPTKAGIVVSPLWKVTSGSLFHNSGTGWTGRPDDIGPNATSSNGNHSVVFRMVSKRTDIQDASVTFTLKNNGFVTSPSTAAQSYDGVHLFLRYQSEENLYAVTLNRRDNTILVKKKIPGGPSNGGTYFTISRPVTYNPPIGTWQWFVATVRNQSDGSVRIEVKDANGRTLLTAVDDGSQGGPPITHAGRVGVRGDNCNFQMGRLIANAI